MFYGADDYRVKEFWRESRESPNTEHFIYVSIKTVVEKDGHGGGHWRIARRLPSLTHIKQQFLYNNLWNSTL